MRTTSKTLALRDPSLAAALGALPGADYGADFGGGISPYDPSRNIGFGADMGYGFGVDAAMVAPHPPAPPAAHMHAHPAAHPHHPHHQAWLQAYHGYMKHHMTPPFWEGRYGYYGAGIP